MVNLHKKLVGEVPMVYNGPAALLPILVGTTVASAGVGLYQAHEQKRAAGKAQAQAQSQAAEQKAAADAAAKAQAEALAKQEAEAAKQKALVEEAQAKADKAKQERKGRLSHNELLSGSEKGLTSKPKGTLLA